MDDSRKPEPRRFASTFPDEAATTTGNLARRLRLGTTAIDQSIEVLLSHGLVEKSSEDLNRAHFKLTRAGAEHFQRDPSAPRAEPPNLPVWSDRVRSVLDYRAANGPTRTVRVGEELDIGHKSINALMQYLRRRGLIRKAGASHIGPHELTCEVRRARDDMRRRGADPIGPG
jgi:hypothetical protein